MLLSTLEITTLDCKHLLSYLRLGEDAQFESRLVAQQVSDYMSSWFPTSWEYLVTNKIGKT